MPNAYIRRQRVHELSESIGDTYADHAPALTRLLKEQRRISRFFEENGESMDPATGGVGVYLLGVVARIFDIVGGRLRSATWAQVRDAARRVQGAAEGCLPLDDGFEDRVRAVAWRAQPHVLDEALMALFDREEVGEEEVDLSRDESAKLFFLLWVAVEVMDENWRPPKDFSGDAEYAYLHIEPKKRDSAEAG